MIVYERMGFGGIEDRVFNFKGTRQSLAPGGGILLRFILLIMIYSCNKTEDAIFIVPKNYTGYIIVITDQKTGEKPKNEGEKRVYYIPKNGILMTQFSNNSGWSNFPEFYYEKITPENKITFTFDPNAIPLNKIVAHGGTVGVVNKDNEGKNVIRYVQYYIGNKAQIDTAYEKAEKLDMLKLAE